MISTITVFNFHKYIKVIIKIGISSRSTLVSGTWLTSKSISYVKLLAGNCYTQQREKRDWKMRQKTAGWEIYYNYFGLILLFIGDKPLDFSFFRYIFWCYTNLLSKYLLRILYSTVYTFDEARDIDCQLLKQRNEGTTNRRKSI